MEEENVVKEKNEYPCHHEAGIWGVLLLSLFFAASAFLAVTVVWMQNVTLQAEVERKTGALRGGQTKIITEGFKQAEKLDEGFARENGDMEISGYDVGLLSDDETTITHKGEATISAEWSYNDEFERVCVDSMADVDYKMLPNGLNPLSVYCFEEGEEVLSSEEGFGTLRVGSVDWELDRDIDSNDFFHTVELLEVVE